MKDKFQKTRINDQIRCAEVRVVDSAGNQAGIMTPKDAIKLAVEDGLDLVEVSPNSNPPVCRIMNYGKYKFQQSKKLQDAKRKQKIIQVKEIKFKPRIDDHDFEFKVKHIRRFIEKGDKVRAFVHFRGREMAHRDLGLKLLERVVEEIADIAVVEKKPSMERNQMSMILTASQPATKPTKKSAPKPPPVEAADAAESN